MKKKRIEEIQQNLNEAEKTDYIYMTAPVKQLRHHVLYLHTTFEASIDKLIIDHILEDANLTPQTVQKKINIRHHIRMVLNELDFSKKLKIIQKQKPSLKTLAGKLMAVNDIRVHFAHSTTYRAQLMSYQVEKNLLHAYETLNSALEALKKEGIEDRPLVLYPPIPRSKSLGRKNKE